MIKIVTHSGSFHPDDVFAVATLLLQYPDAQVIRSRDKEIIKSADIAVDVGAVYDQSSLRFDHHQSEGAGVRPNGVPYASFGLVWKEFGEGLAGAEAAYLIEEKLVIPIDAPDNGVSTYSQLFENIRPYTISDFLYSYVADRNSDEEYMYQIFIKVVNIVKDLLAREILKAKEKLEGMKKVHEILNASKDKRIIVLDQDLPWESVLVSVPEASFVIYKRKEGNWGVKGIPETIKDFKRKKLLPVSWAGKEGQELRDITGISDAVFCHRDRFIAAAETKESAIKLAEIALNA